MRGIGTLGALALLVCTAGCDPEAEGDVEVGMREAQESVQAALTDFQDGARDIVDGLGREVSELEDRYENASEASAEAWDRARSDIAAARRDLEADLMRLRSASEDEADALRLKVSDDLAALTARVERVRLGAIEGGRAFVAESRSSLDTLGEELDVLTARSARLGGEDGLETRARLDALAVRAEELGGTLGGLADAADQEIARQREQITQAIVDLSASIRREGLELERGLAG